MMFEVSVCVTLVVGGFGEKYIKDREKRSVIDPQNERTSSAERILLSADEQSSAVLTLAFELDAFTLIFRDTPEVISCLSFLERAFLCAGHLGNLTIASFMNGITSTL